MTIKLLNESPVVIEATREEIRDRLDPDSLYSTFLHKKRASLDTVELSELVKLREETSNPKQRTGTVASIDLAEVDASFGTVLPRKLDGSRVKGLRAVYRSGDILFARIRPYLRRTAFVSDHFEDGICSKEFYVLAPRENVKPFYLLMMLRSKYCVSQARGKVTGSSRPRTPPEKIKKMRIPKLGDSAQEKIDAVVRAALVILDSSRLQIDSIILGLSATLNEILPKGKLSKTVEISPPIVGARLNPEFYSVQQWLAKLDVKKLQTTSLADVASFSDEVVNPRDRPMQLFDYIEIQNVNPRTGQIDSFSQVLGKDAAGRARRLLKAGQILISTTRPARGSIAIVPEYHDSDVASSGFQVIEAKDGLPVAYIYCALRSDFCLIQMWGKSTGTGYPEITRDELETLRIPIPCTLVSNDKLAEVDRIIAFSQAAKVALIELESYIDKRLEDEVSDSDIVSICEGLIETLNLAVQGVKPIPRANRRRKSEKTLNGYFASE